MEIASGAWRPRVGCWRLMPAETPPHHCSSHHVELPVRRRQCGFCLGNCGEDAIHFSAVGHRDDFGPTATVRAVLLSGTGRASIVVIFRARHYARIRGTVIDLGRSVVLLSGRRGVPRVPRRCNFLDQLERPQCRLVPRLGDRLTLGPGIGLLLATTVRSGTGTMQNFIAISTKKESHLRRLSQVAFNGGGGNRTRMLPVANGVNYRL